MSEYRTAWIRVRRGVTRRLIRIQDVCIWHLGRAWWAKEKYSLLSEEIRELSHQSQHSLQR